MLRHLLNARRLHTAFRTIVVGLAAVCAASIGSIAAANEAVIKRTLEQRLQGMQIQAVSKSPYGNLWEVRTADNDIFYTDEKVTFIFVGSVRDGQNPQRDLTEERRQRLSAINFNDLPFGQAFKMVRGKGTKQIAYFSDPNCPYCRQVEREFQQMDDVTIHVFMYPILSADSMPKARAVWCSADRQKTWQDMMLNGVQPQAAKDGCDTPLERNLAFGQKIRVNSVPTMIFPNGVRVAGYRPAAELMKAYDQPALTGK